MGTCPQLTSVYLFLCIDMSLSIRAQNDTPRGFRVWWTSWILRGIAKPRMSARLGLPPLSKLCRDQRSSGLRANVRMRLLMHDGIMSIYIRLSKWAKTGWHCCRTWSECTIMHLCTAVRIRGRSHLHNNAQCRNAPMHCKNKVRTAFY